jgi:SAM-dependent methyltransferase
MAKESNWEEKETLEALGKRGLSAWYPALRSYLYPGAEVLDVGCGPGPITLDIAAEVYPGSVVGVDAAEKTIDQATKLAERFGVRNVTFRVGDAHCLEFAPGTFDIAYSSNLLVWLRDPVRVLEEQKRVTRQGGWVAAGIGDWGTIVIHPPCPAFEKWLAALPHLNDPSDTEIFVSFNLGREAVALFSRAGFHEIKVEGCVTSRECVYFGSEHFDSRYNLFQIGLDPKGQWPMVKKLFELELLDEETVLAAQKELEEWHTHPHAFLMETSVLAAGKVPQKA